MPGLHGDLEEGGDEATEKANQEAEALRKEKDAWASWGSKKADEAADKFNAEKTRKKT